MKSFSTNFIFLLLFALCGCATTSPLATARSDIRALAGEWEEEWPGQESNDRYRVEVIGEKILITPLTNTDRQVVRDVAFRHKQLDFVLEFDGSAIYYNLILISPELMSGRARGGSRNFDEPVRWYKIH